MDWKDSTILRVAVEKGYTELVEWLFENHPVSSHAHVKPPRTLLHVVRNPGTMSILLARGVDPTVTLANGLTLLMWHAKADQLETIERLLQDPRVRGTINVRTEKGQLTALHFVAAAVTIGPST